MTDRELMQQALEALENLQGLCTDAADGWVEAVTIWTPEIITALRERLAQPEQEPIAWVYQEGLEALKSGRPWTAYGSNGYSRIPLYLNDAVARRVEPPVAESGAGFESLPASPKWQGLTDEEKAELDAKYGDDMLKHLDAVEAKLKEKNG